MKRVEAAKLKTVTAKHLAETNAAYSNAAFKNQAPDESEALDHHAS